VHHRRQRPMSGGYASVFKNKVAVHNVSFLDRLEEAGCESRTLDFAQARRGKTDRKGVVRVRTINGIDEAKARVGEELGVTGWHAVTQEDIDAFADISGDHQFIHVDVDRAKETPFGGTIAHGYYTLSLAPRFTYELLSFDGFAFAVNYGLNKVRFPAPLPVGSKVRMRATVASVDDVPGGIQLTLSLQFERDGGDKPVCVAESLARLYTGAQ
jgi:acyl dehydratase